MKRKKTDKNRLVKRYLEHEPRANVLLALGRKDRGRGVYVLYKGDRVYYVGLSKKSLRSRLRGHDKSRKHRRKWDNYSFYQVTRRQYIKDLESLLLRICRPPGNGVGGRFRNRYNLRLRRKRK